MWNQPDSLLVHASERETVDVREEKFTIMLQKRHYVSS